MTYLTENPLPGIIILGSIAVIAWISGTQYGKRISLVCIACSVGLYFLEQALVSTGEEVEATVVEMLEHFKKEDINAIRQQIADKDPELVGLSERGLELVDFRPNFQVKSTETTISPDQKTVTAYIRANGQVDVAVSGAGTRHVATYWKTTWIQQNSQWKLEDVTRLNPTDGAEMEIFGRQ